MEMTQFVQWIEDNKINLDREEFRKWRLTAGFNQGEISVLLGITQTALSQWERGANGLNEKYLKILKQLMHSGLKSQKIRKRVKKNGAFNIKADLSTIRAFKLFCFNRLLTYDEGINFLLSYFESKQGE